MIDYLVGYAIDATKADRYFLPFEERAIIVTAKDFEEACTKLQDWIPAAKNPHLRETLEKPAPKKKVKKA